MISGKGNLFKKSGAWELLEDVFCFCMHDLCMFEIIDEMMKETELQIVVKAEKERTYVYLWLIHVDVRQRPTQYCRALSSNLKKRKCQKPPKQQYDCTSNICTLWWTGCRRNKPSCDFCSGTCFQDLEEWELLPWVPHQAFWLWTLK